MPDPTADFRIALLTLLAPTTGCRVVEIAPAAEAWIFNPQAQVHRHEEFAPPADPRADDAGVGADRGAEDPGGPSLGANAGDAEQSGGPPAEEGAGPQAVPEGASIAPRRRQSWTPERIALLGDLCRQGLDLMEIGAAVGLGTEGSTMWAIDRHGFGAAWRAARKISAPAAGEPAPVPEPEPAQGDVEVPAAPAAAPPSRDDLIARHIAAHGVTRAVDFGADQPAVDALRAAGHEVIKLRRAPAGRVWRVNGRGIAAQELWRMANKARQAAGLPPIRRKEAA